METIARNLRHHGWYSLVVRIKAEFERWSINFATRKELLQMDASQLRDIGVDSVAAEKEGRKPFWLR